MGHITKRGDRYRARWTEESGKERSRSFAKRSEAKAHLAWVESRIAEGTYVEASRERAPFEQYADQWWRSRGFAKAAKRNTDNALRLHILPKFGGIPIGGIDRAMVQDFVNELHAAKGLRASTIRNILDVLTRMLRDAVDERHLARSPIPARGPGGIHIPGREEVRERYLTRQEVGALLRAAPREFAPLVVVMADSGLRIGEALGLNAGAIDLDHGIIRVDRQLTQDGEVTHTKTRSTRSVPLSPAAQKALEPLLVGKQPQDPIWLNSEGGRLRYQTCRRAWKLIVERSSLDWSPVLHDLRHYYASVLLKEGVAITEVSRALGHASPTKTLSVYAHVIGDAHDGIRRVLNTQTWADGQTTAS